MTFVRSKESCVIFWLLPADWLCTFLWRLAFLGLVFISLAYLFIAGLWGICANCWQWQAGLSSVSLRRLLGDRLWGDRLLGDVVFAFIMAMLKWLRVYGCFLHNYIVILIIICFNRYCYYFTCHAILSAHELSIKLGVVWYHICMYYYV